MALANGTPAHNDLGLLIMVVFYMQLDGVSSAGAMERGWVWLWQNNIKKYNSYNLSVFRGCYMKNRDLATLHSLELKLFEFTNSTL